MLVRDSKLTPENQFQLRNYRFMFIDGQQSEDDVLISTLEETSDFARILRKALHTTGANLE
jgi:hypothetical protein